MRRILLCLAILGTVGAVAGFPAADPSVDRPNAKPLDAPSGIPGEFINANPDEKVFDRFSINLPPTVAVAAARNGKGSKITIVMTITSHRTEEREERTPLGKNTRIIVHPTVTEVTTTVDYDDPSARRGTEVFDTKGKRVDAKTIRAALKKHSPVLVSCHGEVDPFYLRVVKDDTLVIVLGPRDGSEDRVRALLNR